MDSEPHADQVSEEPGNKLPSLSEVLGTRIRLFRRDIGSLLVHFTRGTGGTITREFEGGSRVETPRSAGAVLDCILSDGGLRGTATYIRSGEPCVCFTEAPLHEFSTLFSLNQLAASQEERPRYEPYGIVVNKEWLFSQGGRPVIYDAPDTFDALPQHLKHRFVPYDPGDGIDHTWEREWRVQTDWLELQPMKTLVVVPTADEAARIVHTHVDWEPETEYTLGGPIPIWLTVSLDVFGLEPSAA